MFLQKLLLLVGVKQSHTRVVWVFFELLGHQPRAHIFRVDDGVLSPAHVFLSTVFERLHVLEFDLEWCEHGATIEGRR